MAPTAALALIASILAAAAPGGSAADARYTMGGMTADFSSMVMVDMAHIERLGTAVHTALLQAPRNPLTIQGQVIAYSVLDTVIDCTARTMRAVAFTSYGPGDAVTVSGPAGGELQHLVPGSTFDSAANVACSGQARTPDAPILASRRLAADYARMILRNAKERAVTPAV